MFNPAAFDPYTQYLHRDTAMSTSQYTPNNLDNREDEEFTDSESRSSDDEECPIQFQTRAPGGATQAVLTVPVKKTKTIKPKSTPSRSSSKLLPQPDPPKDASKSPTTTNGKHTQLMASTTTAKQQSNSEKKRKT